MRNWNRLNDCSRSLFTHTHSLSHTLIPHPSYANRCSRRIFSENRTKLCGFAQNVYVKCFMKPKTTITYIIYVWQHMRTHLMLLVCHLISHAVQYCAILCVCYIHIEREREIWPHLCVYHKCKPCVKHAYSYAHFAWPNTHRIINDQKTIQFLASAVRDSCACWSN